MEISSKLTKTKLKTHLQPGKNLKNHFSTSSKLQLCLKVYSMKGSFGPIMVSCAFVYIAHTNYDQTNFYSPTDIYKN